LIGYDPKGEVIYYESVDNSPTQRAVYSINKKGKKQKLSTGTGTNSVRFSSNFAYYTSYFNSATEPMNIAVIDTKSGKNLRTLVDNKQLIDSLSEYRFSHKEFFTVKTKSNQTLNAWMVKPADFDSTKSYPMLMIQYSGPNSQMATDSFSIGWEQYLATQGIITVCVDGRGTAARGEEFRKCTYLQMGILESQDQIEAAQALSELSYIDANRMAIWGWSFGGYNTLLALSRGEGTFKLGIAVAPVTDWRYYDSAYTERFMRTNNENKDGYDISSPTMLVDNLKGKLLLIHGTADDNVHFKQSMDYAEKLVQAGKQFDMFIYRDRNHSIYGGNTRMHLYTKMANYLKENL
ncbi:MAG: prolyl oligopeptidase family serine peptidase, partial [Rikenellaceae bacterium]